VTPSYKALSNIIYLVTGDKTYLGSNKTTSSLPDIKTQLGLCKLRIDQVDESPVKYFADNNVEKLDSIRHIPDCYFAYKGLMDENIRYHHSGHVLALLTCRVCDIVDGQFVDVDPRLKKYADRYADKVKQMFRNNISKWELVLYSKHNGSIQFGLPLGDGNYIQFEMNNNGIEGTVNLWAIMCEDKVLEIDTYKSIVKEISSNMLTALTEKCLSSEDNTDGLRDFLNKIKDYIK
jgi:hypothetical protein